jgi:hypothetical protein
MAKVTITTSYKYPAGDSENVNLTFSNGQESIKVNMTLADLDAVLQNLQEIRDAHAREVILWNR